MKDKKEIIIENFSKFAMKNLLPKEMIGKEKEIMQGRNTVDSIKRIKSLVAEQKKNMPNLDGKAEYLWDMLNEIHALIEEEFGE